MHTNKSRNSLTAMPLLLFGCLITLLTVSALASFNSMSHDFRVAAMPPAAQQQTELDTHWRYTRFGWQDSSFWQRTPAELGPRTIDRISPVLFSIDIILAALGTMIWLSDDWQVDRLFGRKSRRAARRTFDDLARKARIRRAQRES